MAFFTQDNLKMGRAIVLLLEIRDAITTLGNNKAASLLLLSFAKVSSTKDLLNRQICQGILCVST